jgi:hypothetical protein
MTLTRTTDPRHRVRELQTELAEARDEQVSARAARDQMRAEFARNGGDVPTDGPAGRRVQRCLERLEAADDRVEALTDEQTSLLGAFTGAQRNGNRNVARAGEGPFEDGWAQLAAQIDPAAGQFQAEVSLGELMKPSMYGATTITPSSGLVAPAYEVPGVQAMARDTRFIYPWLRAQEVDRGDLAVQSFEQRAPRTVSGSIERDPVATTEKAKLALALELVNPPLKQLAVLADAVPNALFDATAGLGDLAGGEGLLVDWLRAECSFQLSRALDAHIMAQFVAAKASIAFGETGTGLITQIRNAVSAHRALGASPSIIVVTPKLAAELDSLEDAQKRPIFATRDTGGASPLFGLTIVETVTAETHAPLLIDPSIVGVNYYSVGSVLIDPFSESKSNRSTLRMEANDLFHIRDFNGAYVLSKEALK